MYEPVEAVQLDVSLARYTMRGTDGVTPQSAYPDANVLVLGARFAW